MIGKPKANLPVVDDPVLKKVEQESNQWCINLLHQFDLQVTPISIAPAGGGQALNSSNEWLLLVL
jgi:hypothetical protein